MLNENNRSLQERLKLAEEERSIEKDLERAASRDLLNIIDHKQPKLLKNHITFTLISVYQKKSKRAEIFLHLLHLWFEKEIPPHAILMWKAFMIPLLILELWKCHHSETSKESLKRCRTWLKIRKWSHHLNFSSSEISDQACSWYVISMIIEWIV